ncbi:MAG: 1-deoxy-D-xylulose-5-phosphate synthase [Candidatus Marinimicrobia bacterium]|nr:1-deoxy-D-xylulose-5-phosphate synthase [Candidatus Neomarinimicrobiota bacterium]
MKYLNNIKSPEDLKSYSKEDLELICHELREYIISTITQIGGHLAPTLGTIELTTALHYVYNAPKDKLIWDTGHQAYAHKVLTGRFDSFDTIRKYKGLSGFLKRTESEYDVFGAGHASTSISAGLGVASARDLNNEDFKVVSIIGDGALTGGLAFEALNNAGHLKKQLLVIVNDNDMSISPNVGAFRNYLVKITTNQSYNYIRSQIGRLIRGLPRSFKFIESLLRRAEISAKNFFLPTTIFEDLGFRYFGPVDGHNVNELVDTLTNIKDLNSPVVLHVITKKGKGLDNAENDPIGYHGVKEKQELPNEKNEQKPIFQNIFGDVSCELARDNEDIVAITAAMREGTGLVNFAKEFPNRYFDVGIAEAHAVTFAGGLAANEKTPIVAIYSTFLQRAYDQIIHDISLQKLPVIFCLDRSGLVGEDGATHHGVLDIAYMRCIQGMIVTAPKDGNELKDLLFTATNYNKGPFSIRYPKESSINFDNKSPNIIEIGSWEVINKGDDILILSVGSMVNRSMIAMEKLKEKNIQAEVINCRFIKPMDLDYLSNNFSRFSKVVTIEEGVLDGGFGEGVVSWSNANNFKNDILNLGLPNDFVDHGSRRDLLQEVKLDSKSLYMKIMEFVNE